MLCRAALRLILDAGTPTNEVGACPTSTTWRRASYALGLPTNQRRQEGIRRRDRKVCDRISESH